MNDLLSFVPPSHHKPDPSESQKDPPTFEELQEAVGRLVGLAGSARRERHEREYRLRNFRSEKHKLTDDLIVVIEEIDGQFVASSLDTDQYGHGFSQEDAIQSLCEVIEEYYEVLQEEEGRLAPALESHLRYLRDILEERK